MISMDLSNQIAMVTGAGGGIGGALSLIWQVWGLIWS